MQMCAGFSHNNGGFIIFQWEKHEIFGEKVFQTSLIWAKGTTDLLFLMGPRSRSTNHRCITNRLVMRNDVCTEKKCRSVPKVTPSSTTFPAVTTGAVGCSSSATDDVMCPALTEKCLPDDRNRPRTRESCLLGQANAKSPYITNANEWCLNDIIKWKKGKFYEGNSQTNCCRDNFNLKCLMHHGDCKGFYLISWEEESKKQPENMSS